MSKINCFKDDYYFLSNFYHAPVTYDGITYRSSEGAYQAQKTKTKEERYAFSNLNSPNAKRLGQEIDIRQDWDKVRIYHMTAIVRLKFMQNPELAQMLLDTGYATLIEGNTWGDHFWGQVDGEGENHLGLILMQVREEIREFRRLQQGM